MKRANHWIKNLGSMRQANQATLGQINPVPIEKKKKGEVISKIQEWSKIKKIQEKAFLRAEITECELKLTMCKPKMFLTFAHGKKRKELNQGELANLIVLACQPCHEYIEYKIPKSQMLQIVQDTIKARKVPIPEL